MMTSSSLLSSLLMREKGMGISSSAGYAPLASMVKEANRELCFRLTERPGQKPRPAMISPSGLRELWLEPMVAPAAILLCPITNAAQRNELLWCCSCAGKINEFNTSQQEMVALLPRYELISLAPYFNC